jgi:hypothetical protein
MIAIFELLEALLHLGGAVRWLFSRSYRRRVREEGTWPDVAIGLLLLSLLIGCLIYALRSGGRSE